MTSRLTLAAKAVRPALPARAVFSGPPGAGKTRTSLIAATVLAEGGDILLIDTEQESALTYADDFDFTHLPWRPPFDPRELAATLTDAGGTYAVVIVDSLSHFWRGEGGVLDIAGGKFSNWKDARPVHETMVQALLDCKAHFIGCARSKVEHVQEVDPRTGKQVVRKVGMSVIQDDSLEYELNVACELDMDHSFVVSKSRTVAVPVGRVFKPEQVEQFAETYRDWLKGGEPPAPGPWVAALRERIESLPAEVRKECKAAFVAALGRPDSLPESRMAAAEALVARFEGEGPGPDGPPAGPGPDVSPSGPPPAAGPDAAEAAPVAGETAEEVTGPDPTTDAGHPSAPDASVIAWKDEDPDDWDRWRKRCHAKAGPGSNARPHPRLLDEDKTVYEAQCHGLAAQASRKLRGPAHDPVTSWNDVTFAEAKAIEDALDALKDGTAVMVEDATHGWVCQRSTGGGGTPPATAAGEPDAETVLLLRAAMAEAVPPWTEAKVMRRAKELCREELGLEKLPPSFDALAGPGFEVLVARLAQELAA